ncbi:MAG: sensor domain-containing diguanylate cyclase [Gemmatimonadota bacterium]|jgi:diguanylate cyclase (GGDEF)-like protein
MTARPNTQAAHVRAWPSDALAAYGTQVVAGVYVGCVLFAPWLGHGVLALAAAGTGAIVVWNARDSWRAGRRSALAVAAWPPAHLLVMAAEGPAGPALPVLAAWAVLLAFTQPVRSASVRAALATLLVAVVAAWAGNLSLGGGVETVLAMVSGGVLGGVGRHLAGSMEGKARQLERILEDARAGRTDPLSVAVRRSEEMSEAVEEVRARLGAERAVLWDVIEDGARARPRIVAGETAPPTITLNGDPLRWVWEETLPLRLDVPPVWALPETRMSAISILGGSDRYALLTVEWHPDGDVAVSLQALQDVARYLRALARLQIRETAADAARTRFAEMLDFVRQLPGEMDPETFPDALAQTARAVVGATGALVASVENESGRVLANVGEDGGPAVGAYFGPMESDCGWVIRTRTRMPRLRTDSHGQRPIVANGERWHAQPRAVLALPLLDPKSEIRGILAIWSSQADDLDSDAVKLLEVFAPVFALQLQHAGDLVKLRERVTADALTGLHNRGAFDERLEAEQQLFLRYRHPAALIVADIDHFKRVNDTYGHEAGDAVLRMIGEVIEGTVREVDYAARYGGEEFVVLLPDTMRAAAIDVAERLRAAVEARTVVWNEERIQVQASFGVSACTECVDTPAQLVQSADDMLYRSKEAGRNRVTAALVGRDEE